MSSEEVINYYKNGGYLSSELYNNDPRLKKVLDQLRSDMYSSSWGEYDEIFNHLVTWNDEFFVLKDFDAFVKANDEINNRYKDRDGWNKSAVINIAKSGRFSSDNTILRYAKEIWGIDPYFVV